MKILGLQCAHDASACIIDNNRITFYQEEAMLSGIKKDYNIKFLWKELSNQYYDNSNNTIPGITDNSIFIIVTHIANPQPQLTKYRAVIQG